MRKGVISAGSDGTIIPCLNGSEGAFQTPSGHRVLKTLCDLQAGCSVLGGILNIADVE